MGQSSSRTRRRIDPPFRFAGGSIPRPHYVRGRGDKQGDMKMHLQSTSDTRRCAYCEAVLTTQRKYCSRACINRGNRSRAYSRGEGHYAWKGDDAGENTKRRRARKLMKIDACQQCGATAVDRHHKDGNTGNNDPSNLIALCRRCHMQIDGRLDQFAEMRIRNGEKRRSEIRHCSNCGQPYKPLRKGRCGKCSDYWYDHGIERPING